MSCALAQATFDGDEIAKHPAREKPPAEYGLSLGTAAAAIVVFGPEPGSGRGGGTVVVAGAAGVRADVADFCAGAFFAAVFGAAFLFAGAGVFFAAAFFAAAFTMVVPQASWASSQ
ncbi:MAG: hypothetical protein Q8O67_33050 [Deltaproteobacteria bacterium]|nr:hypothetical protein [Deltaproteobacteria bacterium]